jgi:hypothetical protein
MNTESRDLRIEAESIIRELNLFEALRPYGNARVVGSVALNLVVKPDIDLHLLTESDDLITVVDAVYHFLLAQDSVKQVHISDYRNRGGLKVGVDSYPGRLAEWSIDIWVTNSSETTGFALVDRLNRQLTVGQRKAILEIKRTLHAEHRLRDGISTWIYLAVVDRGVRSVSGFEKYMKERSNQVLEARDSNSTAP